MSFAIVRSLPEAQWRRFVLEHPAANIFHTPEMFQVFERAKGYRPKLWAALDSEDSPRAMLLPVHVSVMGGIARSLTTRAVAYGSVLCSPESDDLRALANLLEVYEHSAKGALFTELRNLADLCTLQVTLQMQGFAYEPHLNYLVDLDCSAEQVMQNIGSRTRKNIRRALRNTDLVVEEVTRLEQIDVLYALLKKTYFQAQVPLADKSLFEAAFTVLYPKDMVKFLMVRLGSEYIAASVELLFKHTIYGWYGGVDREYGKFCPNELLLWYIFEWSATHGYKIYDFGGAGRPDEEYGVRDFKAKFGGELVCYGRNVYVNSKILLMLSKVGYQIYRRFL